MISEALKHNDGLAVFSIFMEMAARDNSVLKRVTDRLKPIEHINSEVELTHSLQLMDLLPGNTDNFYRYNGSQVDIKFNLNFNKSGLNYRLENLDDTWMQRGSHLDNI